MAFAGFFRTEIDRTGVLTAISRVLDGARSAGAKVVYTRVVWQPGVPDLHVNSPLLGVVAQTKCLEDGSHGAGDRRRAEHATGRCRGHPPARRRLPGQRTRRDPARRGHRHRRLRRRSVPASSLSASA